MSEQELVALGFNKHTDEDLDEPFYYYTLDIVEGLYCITDVNDTTIWMVGEEFILLKENIYIPINSIIDVI